MEPTEVFDAYWRFAAERYETFWRRRVDPIGPWSCDPIIAEYRFTNSYRALDRVTQYLMRKVQYGESRSQAPTEVVFRTLLFKLFNKIETWEALERRLGPLRWDGLHVETLVSILDELWAAGRTLYSGAYIMPAPRLGHVRKHANHIMLLRTMMEDDLPARIMKAGSLARVYELLRSYKGIGSFLAYQFTIDLNYSSLLCFDEDDFVVAGPGAIDGISKCFRDLGHRSSEDVIRRVTAEQENHFQRLGIRFDGLWGRRLKLIDCQNLFCEISKYARVAFPGHVGQSKRFKIKRGYSPDGRPFDELFFPPHWEISQTLAQAAA